MRRKTLIGSLSAAMGLCLGVAAIYLLQPQNTVERNQTASAAVIGSPDAPMNEPAAAAMAAQQEVSASQQPESKAGERLVEQSEGLEPSSARAERLASRFYKAMHTFDGKKEREDLMETIYREPALHAEALKSLSDLDYALAAYGEEQATARALFGRYLQHLAEKGHSEEIESVISAVSRDLTNKGDRKGRRLDLEDAVLAWIDAVGNEVVVESPEATVGRLRMTSEGWKVAGLALSNRIPALWESESLREQMKAAMRKGTVE